MGLLIIAAKGLLLAWLGKTGGSYGDLSSPKTWYLAAFTTLPAADGTGGVEVTGGSYGRVAMAESEWTTPTDASPSVTSNVNQKDFTTATADWGTIVGMGLADASTAGSVHISGSLTASVTINNGQTLRFPIGNITISFA